jgi:hypothetical protein
VKKRTDLEFGGYAVVSDIRPDKYVRAREQSHLGVADFIGLPARHDEPEWLERLPPQKLPESLQVHELALSRFHFFPMQNK